MNNEEKINDFINHMPENITSRQKEALFQNIKDAIKENKDVKIYISVYMKILV